MNKKHEYYCWPSYITQNLNPLSSKNNDNMKSNYFDTKDISRKSFKDRLGEIDMR